MQPSEEIKQKLDIVEFIRTYIDLTPAGVNFKANCPFHKEKTPSFIVSPDKQIWHCFGCGKGGDIFSFLMEMERVEFVEALKILAPKAGVALKEYNPKKASERSRLLEALDLARRYYHKVLMDSPAGKPAWNYLVERGLDEDTIEEWQIGYSPDSWDGIVKFLRERKFTDQEIFKAGLTAKSTTNNRGYYDRFRARIMFPIMDINGNTVAFSARVSPQKEALEKMGKYINSPRGTVYDKSNILFGMDKAKQYIREQKHAVIVEGQMDVITAHQNGFKNVIASSGTALTGEQLNIIKRFTDNIKLAFDQDEAGVNAAERGMALASQAEMNVKVIEVPEGKDPDDCIKSDPNIWKEAVKNAKPMMQYYMDKYLDGLNVNNIDEKREAIKRVMPKIYLLKNKIDQDFWLRRLSSLSDTPEHVLRDVLRGIKPERSYYKKPELKPEPESVNRQIGRTEKQSELALAMLIKFFHLIEYAIKNLEINYLQGEANISLYKNLIMFYNYITNEVSSNSSDFLANNRELAKSDYFFEWLETGNSQKNKDQKSDQLLHFNKLVILSDEDFYDLKNDGIKEEFVKIVKELKKNYLIGRRREIEKVIAEAEAKGENADDWLKELVSLNEEIRTLEF